jgi:D-3-phosphoglycerate dehydrogenase / 2-oxoglutarate reductase
MKPLVLMAMPPLHPDGVACFGDEVDVRVASDPSAATIIREGRDAVAIVGRGGTFIDGEIFDALAGLLVGVSGGSGADCFDVPAATERGIPILNNPGRIVGVPEYVMTVIPLLSKRLLEMDRSMRRGEPWWPRDGSGSEVSGKTIGVVGFGHLGREVARRAKVGFDMRVIAYDPVVDESAFDDAGVEHARELATLLQQADFITLHVPLMESTHHLIGRAEFAAMKQSAVFVNASRGPVVDESALIEALEQGRIRAAAIDVWDPEPPRSDNPLFALDNVIVTPHMAGVTNESRAAGANQVAETVLNALRGVQPQHIRNPSVWPPWRVKDGRFPLAAS